MTISTQTLAGKKPVQTKLSTKTWTVEAVAELYDLPFNDLLYRAHEIHREHFSSGEIELATLLSIKTGGCPEDCAYCPQAARYQNLDCRGGRRTVRLAVQRSAVSSARDSSRALCRRRNRARDSAFDQDRRLPGGLRLLPAGGALPHRGRGGEAAAPRGSCRRRRSGEAKRRDAFLHGRRVARTESARYRKSPSDGERGQSARA